MNFKPDIPPIQSKETKDFEKTKEEFSSEAGEYIQTILYRSKNGYKYHGVEKKYDFLEQIKELS